MAEKNNYDSFEKDIKILLVREVAHREEFKNNLQSLVSSRDQELRKQKTGGDDATVQQLVKRLEDSDAAVTPLLYRCQNVSIDDDVSKRARDAETDENRDSGIGRSKDLNDMKRQGVFLPVESGVPCERVEGEEEVARGFPECGDAGGSPDSNLQGFSCREAQQHTDQSSLDSD